MMVHHLTLLVSFSLHNSLTTPPLLPHNFPTTSITSLTTYTTTTILHSLTTPQPRPTTSTIPPPLSRHIHHPKPKPSNETHDESD